MEEAVVVDANADLVTEKTLLSGDPTPLEGDSVTFQISVTNNGAAQATGVSLTDQLPAGITFTSSSLSQGTYDSATGLWTIGTLNESGVATIELTGTVDVGEGGNTITNITTAASGDQPDPSTAGDDLEEAVVVDANADLVTVKTLASGNATPLEGDVVTFEIEVTNNGVAQATNVSLTDLLPAGLTATAGNGVVTQGTYDSATGLFDIGTLNIGETAILTLEGTVDVGEGGNTITNITTAATGDQPDPSTAGDDLDESVVVDANADLVTVKTLASGNSVPAEGEVVTFEIEVTNNGVAQATNVSLIDLLPAGLTATAGNGVVTQGTYDAAIGLFDIGTLNIGETAILTLEGTVDVGEGGNTITNITTAATGDQPDPSTVGDDLNESVVVDANADLVTEKTLLSGDPTPAEGDAVTFQIAVTNNGASQATGVSLTDQLPSGITFTGSAVSQGSYNSATGLWTIGTLNESGVATIELTGTVDVGEGGNTITNITTAATGDQSDPSTVGDDLEEAVVVENIADLVTEKTLISGNPTPNEGDSVTFQIAVTNNGAAQATGVSLVDQLPAGITFTGSSVSQGSYNAATGLWTVGTIDQGAVAVITLAGTVDVGQAGNTITNITTAATGDQTDPSTAGDDLDESVSPFAVADLGIAKAIVGEPELLFNGNYVATYQLVVENTGNLDLASLSLLEDLSTQFDGAFVDAGNLQLTVAPADPDSSIALNSAGWNGSSDAELVDSTVDSLLVVGDSFTLVFTVEIDPSEVSGTLDNQVVGAGTGVDENGDAILDSSGNPVLASDLSDSGTSTTGTNPGQPGDEGTSDDPVELALPARPLSEISGRVFQDDNNDGIQQAGENGIAGVEVTLLGEDVFGNPVNITVLTDANGDYAFTGLNAGDYVLVEAQPEGYDDGIDVGGDGATIGNDEFSGIRLPFGTVFSGNTFGEILQSPSTRTTSGSPAQLPALAPIFRSPVTSLLSSFLGGPGPIYSGIPINSNANPLTLDSGRPVTGGYVSDGSVSDCGCPEPVNACCQPAEEVIESFDWPDQSVVDTIDEGCCGEEVIVEGCCGEEMVVIEESSIVEQGCEIEAPIACEEADPCKEADPCADGRVLQRPSFLKRLGCWLKR